MAVAGATRFKNNDSNLARLLLKNPGFKALAQDALLKAYLEAREDAADESGLPLETFPASCPYSQEQILIRIKN